MISGMARGAALVAAVAAVGCYHPGPQLGLLLRRSLAGPHGPTPAGDGQFDFGMGHQVAVPVWISVVSSFGGHQHHPVTVDDRRGEHGRARPARLAPTVCNSTAGIPKAEPSTRPLLRRARARAAQRGGPGGGQRPYDNPPPPPPPPL